MTAHNSPAEDSQHATVAAIRAHHAQMGETMADHAAAIAREAGRAGTPAAEDHRAALVTFFTGEVLPHAVAEEGTLYKAAADLLDARLLIQAMIREHGILRELGETLKAARTPGEMAGAAAALNALFHAHLEKENDLLLPALVDAEVDLGSLLAGMHEMLGGAAHQ
jgi:hypothetical protein